MSRHSASIRISAWGAASSLASTARQTGFFLRAGRKSVGLSPFIDQWGEQIPLAYNPTLPAEMTGFKRMVELGTQALRSAWPPPEQALPRRPRIALALPETFAAVPGSAELNDNGVHFLRAFQSSLPTQLRTEPIAAFPLGRAAGVKAVDQAASWIDSGEADAVLAGGVDSYYDWSRLESLLGQDRLLTDDNLDGFFPGEGAAFALLCPGSGPSVARIAGIGTGIESAPIVSGSNSRADGFTAALRQAVGELKLFQRRCDFWFSDLTHEQYGLKEFQILITRFADVFGRQTHLQTPLRELGNIGAATIPMFLALSCESWLRGYSPDRFAVCLAASDTGLRGALLLEGME